MLIADPTQDQKIGSKRYSVKNIIGKPYGSVFELEQRSLKQVDEYDIMDEVPEVSADLTIISGDNSKFNDSNTAQKLSATDLRALKAQGTSGSDIIRNLINNSESWANKSQFAQQKWLAKKQKRQWKMHLICRLIILGLFSNFVLLMHPFRYVRRVRIIRSTPDSICDVYRGKSSDKIW